MPSQFHRTLPRPASSPSTYSTSPSSSPTPFGMTPPQNQEPEQGKPPPFTPPTSPLLSSLPEIPCHFSSTLPTLTLLPVLSSSLLLSKQDYPFLLHADPNNSLSLIMMTLSFLPPRFTSQSHVSLFTLSMAGSPLCSLPSQRDV